MNLDNTLFLEKFSVMFHPNLTSLRFYYSIYFMLYVPLLTVF